MPKSSANLYIMYVAESSTLRARTNRMGFFDLFTNTRMSAEDILRIYRQKDVDGNSTWYGYSLEITIPSGVSLVFVQIQVGWVISNTEPEIIMLKDLLIYIIK